ncbi:hypothetical protein EVAR_57937_1, partial [Eumeta japonica]
PGIDGQVRVVDIRTAHGRLRRPTARLAVLPTEVESSHARTGGGLLTQNYDRPARLSLRPPIKGEGCAGVGPHWPRGKRRARIEGGRARRTRSMRARPATVSPPSTADEETLSTPSSETKFWSALRPPAGRSEGVATSEMGPSVEFFDFYGVNKPSGSIEKSSSVFGFVVEGRSRASALPTHGDPWPPYGRVRASPAGLPGATAAAAAPACRAMLRRDIADRHVSASCFSRAFFVRFLIARVN